MLEYLIQLPCDYLGQNVLGFLDLIDIIQLENGATSHKSQKLLKAIFPYCPPIRLSDSFNQVCLKTDALNWFHSRLCRIKFVRIDFDSLCEVNFEHFIMENIELCLKKYATLRNIESLPNQYIDENVSHVMIRNDQDPAVMEVLFSLLSSVRSLHIQSSNLTEWMEQIKQIGPCLRELTILSVIEKFWSVPFALHSRSADTLLGVYEETDPIFNSSVAKGITSNDTTYWNNKLDSRSAYSSCQY